MLVGINYINLRGHNMSEPTDTKVNSLSTILGQYMSDSDNEEDQKPSKPTLKSAGDGPTSCAKANETNGTAKGSSNTQQTQTCWTECLDQTTGHPYYWNTDTKQVTWEKPEEYVNYLNYMQSTYTNLSEGSWTVGYSEDTHIPYYVNEITRVVSWERPANFKEKPVPAAIVPRKTSTKDPACSSPHRSKGQNESEKKTKANSNRHKKVVKKSLPKHLQSTGSDDEKIEVISEYVERTGSSSEEEEGPSRKIQETGKASEKPVALVAAYAESDTDGECDDSGNAAGKQNSHSVTSGQVEETVVDKPTEISSAAHSIDASSFASIITGGKTDDINMDEEVNKLKEELEKFEENSAAPVNPVELAATEVKEQSFDEKTFQRKRRIEFASKTPNMPSEDDQEKHGKHGFGYSTDNSNKGGAASKNKLKLIAFQKSHVEFEAKLKPETIVYGPQPLSPEQPQRAEVTKVDHKEEIDDFCDIISSKVKFLSTGKPEVSAVQTMCIQLEALRAAFRASCLDSDYFFRWLKTTSDDLQALERNAAPEGWECNWDRDNSQYCYKNLKTNETRWEFPSESGLAETVAVPGKDGDNEKPAPDDDAMDISTTPPPPPCSPPPIPTNCYQWDPGNSVLPVDSVRPADISGELVSFYSDIASIDATASSMLQSENEPADDKATKATSIEDSQSHLRKTRKRKKVKVPGLGSKMQEVSTMVANWQKAQKELGN